MNAGEEPFTVERGMRIAQAVLAPVVRAAWREVDDAARRPRGAMAGSAAPARAATAPRPGRHRTDTIVGVAPAHAVR